MHPAVFISQDEDSILNVSTKKDSRTFKTAPKLLEIFRRGQWITNHNPCHVSVFVEINRLQMPRALLCINIIKVWKGNIF